jgi:hypothetical protein
MTELEVVQNVESAFEDAVDTTVGGAALAADVIRRPRTVARRARRRGAVVTEEVVEQGREAVATAVALPERVLHDGLRRVRGEAARKDAVGTAARALLQAINVQAATAAGFFARLEKETELPAPRAPRGAGTRGRTAASKPAGRRGASARGHATSPRARRAG